MSEIKWTILDNSNIVESYPGITLPLTYSFIKIAYRGVFQGLVSASINNDMIVSRYADVLDNMVTSYKGRIYYCINNWYSLIDFMPFSKKVIPIWQDMMGVQDHEVYLGRQHRFTPLQKTKMYWSMLKNAMRIPKEMARLHSDFTSVKQYFDENYNTELSISELLSLFSEIERRVLKKWYVTLSNDMYAFIWTGILKRKLTKKGIDVAEYISGISSLESLKPIKRLLEIAKQHGDNADVLQTTEVQEYLREYGDRSPCELKLEAMTYRESPSLLEQKIREYASDKKRLDEMLQALACEETPARNTFVVKRARLGIQNREISRLNRSRIYGMVRRIFITIGERLYQNGHIDEPSDVFYLEIGEIQNGVPAEYRQIISNRKIEYAEYEKLPAHSRIVFRGDGGASPLFSDCTTIGMSSRSLNSRNSLNSFTGIGTSSGSITAEAVVLESPNDSVDVKGKIIVTKTTDPGWVFLLTMAGGIVAEKGSLLSHTAIVSRELKIPAVVAVENITSLIKSGDIIKIDGKTGRIDIVRAN
ncbi:MAG: PEP-utilizing enzyme [Defluviitaleaceae bacterium]|nr:PEP-utilizing enzyme [Defluviitaleaceae bacterium]